MAMFIYYRTSPYGFKQGGGLACTSSLLYQGTCLPKGVFRPFGTGGRQLEALSSNKGISEYHKAKSIQLQISTFY